MTKAKSDITRAEVALWVVLVALGLFLIITSPEEKEPTHAHRTTPVLRQP